MCKLIRDNKGMLSTEVAVALIFCISVIAFATAIFQRNASLSAKREENSSKAFYVAEAGINDYVWHLNQDEEYYKNVKDPAELSYQKYKDGEYFLEVQPRADAPGVYITATGKVKIPGTSKYKTRKIKVTVQMKSFTNYMYFSDSEKIEGSTTPIWFVTGDVINGPLHCNDYIYILTNPIFKAPVSTARTLYRQGGSNPVFEQGYSENVPPLDIPSSNSQLKIWAQDGGYYYYGKTDITLSPAGTLVIANTNALSTGPKGTGIAMPPNGVIFVDGQTGSKYAATTGDTFISGTLKGKITVAAANNIYITGNLLYNDNASDMLGLVANNYLYVNHYNQSNQDVAPTNITIYAALFAVKHSFGFERYDEGSKKGVIHAHGSIIQRFRGPVGLVNTTGYSKDYNYDERMLYSEPPHFINPLNTGFGIAKWEEM